MQQVAVITGGARGIGLACAQNLVASGSKVALWDTDAAALAQAKQTLPDARTMVVDVADYTSVEAAVSTTENALGPITQVVNSAGIAGPNAVVEDYPIDAWSDIIQINLTGTFYLLRAILPGMKDRGYGRVVLIASVAGKEGNPNASA